MKQQTKVQPSAAVPVSRNLQLALLLAGALMVAGQAAFLVPMYMFNEAGFSVRYALQTAVFTSMPLLFYAVEYLLQPAYPQLINRMFIAAVKATVFVLLYGAVTMFKTMLMIAATRGAAAGSPPEWITSSTIEWVLFGMTLTVLVLSELWLHRGRRA